MESLEWRLLAVSECKVERFAAILIPHSSSVKSTHAGTLGKVVNHRTNGGSGNGLEEKHINLGYILP